MPRAVGEKPGEAFSQSWPSLCPGGAEERGSLARGGRAPVRRRTRRFGHFALKPGNVFAPRRTTRRQCRVWFGLHRAAGRAIRGERRPAALGRGEARFSPRSAHQNGHFPSLWKMSEMPRAVGRNRAKLFRKAGRLFVRAALRSGEVLRGAAAPLSAAARGVSDTLPSSRAMCSLRGALRGGSAASGSACIGRRAGQNEGERRPAAPGRPLAFFGRGCTIPYRETCFLKERENANGTTGKRP